MVILSFLCDPADSDGDKSRKRGGGHSSTAVHQRFLRGIRKRVAVLLQCDRVVGDTEIGLLHVVMQAP